MINRKTSAWISLGICILSAALLAVWIATFPQFFHWFYVEYHRLSPDALWAKRVVRIVSLAFYLCAPFAAAALGMLIALLRNILRDRVFIRTNVRFLRGVSWCCFAVAAVTAAGGYFYLPLLIITFATAVVGILLRVVKNVMHAAVELREEQDLTI